MRDSWYRDILEYKLTGTINKGEKRNKQVRGESVHYHLMEEGDSDAQLFYQEPTGEYSKCVLQKEVIKVMNRYHDCHGHFAKDMTLRLLKGRFFWPTRSKDVAEYVKSCDSCQRFGPLRRGKNSPNSQRKLKIILNVQPMDMIGIDFVGPISPESVRGMKYILIAVDYFSRFLFATATKRANGEVVRQFFRERVARVLGWPRSVYCDNASYFVKGVFAQELKNKNVIQYTAPITHPSSVGLAEKYVHLLMNALRTALHGPGNGEKALPLEQWDTCIDTVVFAINNRYV